MCRFCVRYKISFLCIYKVTWSKKEFGFRCSRFCKAFQFNILLWTRLKLLLLYIYVNYALFVLLEQFYENTSPRFCQIIKTQQEQYRMWILFQAIDNCFCLRSFFSKGVFLSSGKNKKKIWMGVKLKKPASGILVARALRDKPYFRGWPQEGALRKRMCLRSNFGPFWLKWPNFGSVTNVVREKKYNVQSFLLTFLSHQVSSFLLSLFLPNPKYVKDKNSSLYFYFKLW